MDSVAPAVAAAPASRLDMSLDECIKLSGGSSAARRKGPPPRPRPGKRREKAARKPSAGGSPPGTSTTPPAGSSAGAVGRTPPANATAAGAIAGSAAQNGPAGGISKKRRRSKKPATGGAPTHAEEASSSGVATGKPPPAASKQQRNNKGANGFAAGTAVQRSNGSNNVTPHTAPASSSRLNAPSARLAPAAAAAPSQTPATCRIAVSNLNETVSQEDIKELFGDVGPLVNAKLHKDSSGRSLGRAEVVFVRMADALEAIKRYNGIPLDEMPLRITLATDRSTTAVESVPPAPSGGAPPPQRYARDQRDARRGNRGPQRGIGKSRGGRTAPRSPTER